MEIEMEMEAWAAVPGYDGIYEVSNQGRVRSLDRVIVTKRGVSRRTPGSEIKPFAGDPYWRVTLSNAPRPPRTAAIHSLVLEAFVGSRPAGLVARHLDDDHDNNRLSNLAYGTQSDNSFDAVRNGVHPYARKTHCPKGHPYEGDNLYVTANGNRKCRACRADWPSVRKRAMRAAIEGGQR